MEEFVFLLGVLLVIIVFFTRRRVQRNEDNIEKLIGAITALERTLAQSISNLPPHSREEQESQINMLIARWEEAMEHQVAR